MTELELWSLNSYISMANRILLDLTSFAPKPRRQQLKSAADTICSEWSEILKGNKSGREDFDRALDNFKMLFAEVYGESYQGRLEDSKLTDQQRKFVEHYLECENATEAARRAGYRASSLKVQGYELLQKKHIKKTIERARQKNEG